MAKASDSSRGSRGPEGDPAPEAPPPRVSRHVQPLGPRVLVRIVRSPDRSEAGLFLPQGVKDEQSMALLGEVVEVARTLPKADAGLDEDEGDDDLDPDDARADFGKNVSGIPLGANVLFEKDRGIAIPWDENLRVIEVRYILAIVDIISQDEIQ
jgi:co-chaperonin GroES (HSP10)